MREKSDMTDQRSEPAISPRARQIYESAIVCDNTVPWAGMPFSDTALRDALPAKMKAAGVTFASLTVSGGGIDATNTMKFLAAELRYWEERSTQYCLVKKASDIRQAKRAGQLAIGLHFQGSDPVESNLDFVNFYYQLGIRHMLLAYNQKNLVGYGCHEPDDGGLTAFGYELVKEMNRVGMLVDVAHTGYRTTMDAIAASTSPVICSHGNVAAIHEHPRCYADDQIQAIAASGGVFGLTGLSIFMGSDNNASIGRFVEQIDYAVQLVGARHVGLGLDYVYDMPGLERFARSQPQRWPPNGGYLTENMQQLEHERLVHLTQALLDRGYGDADVVGILGENWVRVAEAVWR
jgi:membrane dipeptidase